MNVMMYRTALGKDGYVSLVSESSKVVCDGNEKFCTPEDMVLFSKQKLLIDENAEEYVYLIALDTKLRINGVCEVSHGSHVCSIVSPRDIFIKLLKLNANTFVLVHNHPSGDPTPSEEDIKVTKTLDQGGKIIGITLADHVIIGNYGSYYSMKENGVI